MIETTLHFPPGFLWGSGTSAFLFEGSNSNVDWSEWEGLQARPVEELIGSGCDWWGGQWEADLQLASQSGQNAIGIGVEWSRIEPTPALWNETALGIYRTMVETALSLGMTPIVTLFHGTLPRWVAARGGWDSADIPRLFGRYVRRVAETMRGAVQAWVTIQEPSVLLHHAYRIGDWPPGERAHPTFLQALHFLGLAHARAYHAIHETDGEALVGVTHRYPFCGEGEIRRATWRREGERGLSWVGLIVAEFLATGRLPHVRPRTSVVEVKATQDYFGLTYRAVHRGDPGTGGFAYEDENGSDGSEYEVPTHTHIGSEIQRFGNALRWAKATNLPVYILGSGVDDSQDVVRPQVIASQVQALWRAVNFNWPVRAYLHWSLLDHFGWHRGWEPRFGLWEVDRATKARIKRPSADLYREICTGNALRSDSVARYASAVFDRLYPPRGPAELLPG